MITSKNYQFSFAFSEMMYIVFRFLKASVITLLTLSVISGFVLVNTLAKEEKRANASKAKVSNTYSAVQVSFR